MLAMMMAGAGFFSVVAATGLAVSGAQFHPRPLSNAEILLKMACACPDSIKNPRKSMGRR